MHQLLKIIVCTAVIAATASSFALAENPFDPMFGPRNPRPGAEAYLVTRADIPETAKQDLLGERPCAVDVLEKLVDAKAVEVRALVGGNRNAPLSVLTKLAQDPEGSVRQYVASNPITPPALLEQLSHDDDQNVIWSLEHNPNWHAK